MAAETFTPMLMLIGGAMVADDVDGIIRDLQAGVAREVAIASDRLRALDARRPAPLSTKVITRPQDKERHIEAAKAFHDKGFVSFNHEKVQKICRRHSTQWAIKLGQWHVTEPYFSDFVELVKRGEAKFKL